MHLEGVTSHAQNITAWSVMIQSGKDHLSPQSLVNIFPKRKCQEYCKLQETDDNQRQLSMHINFFKLNGRFLCLFLQVFFSSKA